MKIILYRHAEPTVSDNEIISGHNFTEWVKKYDQSGIKENDQVFRKEEIIFTSNLERSKETGTFYVGF